MSDWYNHGGYPAQNAAGDSASGRTEFDAIQTATNKLPAITASGGRIVRVNAGATALESVTPATATLELYADAQAGTHTLLGGVAGTNTITATASPTLTAYTTGERFVFLAAAANTAAATLNVDGVGAINLVRSDGSALVANDIIGANYPCHVIKRAADFVLLNPYKILGPISVSDTSVAVKGSATSGSGGTGVWGESAGVAGIGVYGVGVGGWGVVAQGDTTSPVYAALHVVPQNAQPTTGDVGDIYVTTAGKLVICTVAGTPGTWAIVGTQT